MPCCEISDCAQMSKTIIAVRHFGLGGRESLETAVIKKIAELNGEIKFLFAIANSNCFTARFDLFDLSQQSENTFKYNFYY